MLELILKFKIFLNKTIFKLKKKNYKIWKRVRGHKFSFNFFGRTIFRNWIIIYIVFTYMISVYNLTFCNKYQFIHYYIDSILFLIRFLITKLQACWYYLIDYRIMRYVLAVILLWIFWLSIKYLTYRC